MTNADFAWLRGYQYCKPYCLFQDKIIRLSITPVYGNLCRPRLVCSEAAVTSFALAITATLKAMPKESTFHLADDQSINHDMVQDAVLDVEPALPPCCTPVDGIDSGTWSEVLPPGFAQLLGLGMVMIFGHCAGMCGPLILSFRFGVHQNQRQGRVIAAFSQIMCYQLARAHDVCSCWCRRRGCW